MNDTNLDAFSLEGFVILRLASKFDLYDFRASKHLKISRSVQFIRMENCVERTLFLF